MSFNFAFAASDNGTNKIIDLLLNGAGKSGKVPKGIQDAPGIVKKLLRARDPVPLKPAAEVHQVVRGIKVYAVDHCLPPGKLFQERFQTSSTFFLRACAAGDRPAPAGRTRYSRRTGSLPPAPLGRT